MKKFILLAALFVTTAIFASEAAVMETIRGYRTADAAFSEKALDYMTEDFVLDAAGGKVNRKQYAGVVKSAKIMSETNDLEVFMEAAAKFSGGSLTDEQRKQIRAMKDSEKKRTLLIGKEQIKYIQKMAALGVDKEMYKNCVIKGNKAEVMVSVKDPVSAVEVTGKYTLIKKNGKWLIQSIKMDLKK